MNGEHGTWEDLILGHEDLDGDERASADAHLAACPRCQRLLARVRDLESAPGPRGALPALEGTRRLRMGRADARQARASLAALRARLDLGRPAVSRRAIRLAPRVLLPAALAAAALLLYLSRASDRHQVYPREVALVAFSGPRGTEGGADRAEPRTAWRTGESFRIRFELDRPSHPVVIHVDPAGRSELLHPDGPHSPIPLMPGGQPVSLPPAESAVEWTFEGEPGPETFLVSVSPDGRADLVAILGEAAALQGAAGPRAEVVRSLARLLEARLGRTGIVEVEHLP